MLLSPMLKNIQHSVENPVIIFAQDNSQSITLGKDTAGEGRGMETRIEALINDLETDFEVRTFSFSDEVNEGLDFSMDGKQTDMSLLFDELITRFSNRNVGALIVSSDGLYNRGMNPLYASGKIKFPIYTIALGDTNVRRDLFIRKVNFNRIAFLGNTFPIEIVIGANRCRGLKSVMTVAQGGDIVFSKNIDITDDQFSETFLVQAEALNPGLQKYQIRLSAIEDEVSTMNNSAEIFIDVLDSKQKILILAAAPHPDVTAMKEAILSSYNYEVSDFVIDEFTGNVGEYNLVILHQLPGLRKVVMPLINQAKDNDIPLLYILGAGSDYPQFNTLNSGMRIVSGKVSFNEVLPVQNDEFALFTLSSDLNEAIASFPPLLAPFGEFQTLNSANILLYQQIGSLETGYPLILFNQNLEDKTGVIAGEGLWRWKMNNHLMNGNYEAFNELITKIIQFLSIDVDKSFFKVEMKNNFLENEQIEFDAEVYNQSYELINDPEVEITIENNEGDSYPYVFGKTSNAYHLNAGSFAVNSYTYLARVRVGDVVYEDEGAFTVSPLNVETINSIANHNLLYQLAEKHNGSMVTLDQMSNLPDMLNQREDIKTLSYADMRYTSLVNLFWIFILIMLLLTTEWFIRKRNGSY